MAALGRWLRAGPGSAAAAAALSTTAGATALRPRLPRCVTKISDLGAAQITFLLEKAAAMREDRGYGQVRERGQRDPSRPGGGGELTERWKLCCTEEEVGPAGPSQGDLKHKTLLMLFEKPSLRTRVSFETGMTQLGGHAIFYSVQDSPLGEKETIADTAQTLSRFVDAVIARVRSRATVAGLCAHATIPVINALDDFAHPCQILADLQTLRATFGWPLAGLRMAYLGDTRNNVTYDLMRAACLLGIHLHVAGPPGATYAVEPEVVAECVELSRVGGGTVAFTHDPAEAVRGVDAVYTDSWMSYGIPSAAKAERQKQLLPYQVTRPLMALAHPSAIFMNCLPAMRGMEQEAEVIDGPQSVVFDQAENRLHAQKALLHTLLHPGNGYTLPSDPA